MHSLHVLHVPWPMFLPRSIRLLARFHFMKCGLFYAYQ